MQGRFMMSTQYNYAGIDIAKRNFVIAVSSLSKTKTETNNPKGIAHTDSESGRYCPTPEGERGNQIQKPLLRRKVCGA